MTAWAEKMSAPSRFGSSFGLSAQLGGSRTETEAPSSLPLSSSGLFGQVGNAQVMEIVKSWHAHKGTRARGSPAMPPPAPISGGRMVTGMK